MVGLGYVEVSKKDLGRVRLLVKATALGAPLALALGLVEGGAIDRYLQARDGCMRSAHIIALVPILVGCYFLTHRALQRGDLRSVASLSDR